MIVLRYIGAILAAYGGMFGVGAALDFVPGPDPVTAMAQAVETAGGVVLLAVMGLLFGLVAPPARRHWLIAALVLAPVPLLLVLVGVYAQLSIERTAEAATGPAGPLFAAAAHSRVLLLTLSSSLLLPVAVLTATLANRWQAGRKPGGPEGPSAAALQGIRAAVVAYVVMIPAGWALSHVGAEAGTRLWGVEIAAALAVGGLVFGLLAPPGRRQWLVAAFVLVPLPLILAFTNNQLLQQLAAGEWGLGRDTEALHHRQLLRTVESAVSAPIAVLAAVLANRWQAKRATRRKLEREGGGGGGSGG